ncbi:Uncharacterized protein FKW44_024490 [Caligus rogercresseyi]|uniref:Uncharacterized protein n=1 Tax=Caligus rogercresseyi TaxID=217165 RepID=A0A7T8GMU5_CALRO|nr:Uncharacterized protein FKW44_024490 [Caligus rogercresseyi]
MHISLRLSFPLPTTPSPEAEPRVRKMTQPPRHASGSPRKQASRQALKTPPTSWKNEDLFQQQQTTTATTKNSSQRIDKDEPRSASALLSGASSQESLHSDSSQPPQGQSHHRYYHVFREGELDHLINNYVENLHIINSYYDHSNWCIVAEKVNVWTI